MGAESASRTQRLLDLLSFLGGRRAPVTAERILTGMPAYAGRSREGDGAKRESVRRLFERDKRTLREMGVPIRTVDCWVEHRSRREEGYRLERQAFYLPYLRLLRRAAALDGGDGEDGADSPAPPGRGDGHGDGLPRVALPRGDVDTAVAGGGAGGGGGGGVRRGWGEEGLSFGY